MAHITFEQFLHHTNAEEIIVTKMKEAGPRIYQLNYDRRLKHCKVLYTKFYDAKLRDTVIAYGLVLKPMPNSFKTKFLEFPQKHSNNGDNNSNAIAENKPVQKKTKKLPPLEHNYKDDLPSTSSAFIHKPRTISASEKNQTKTKPKLKPESQKQTNSKGDRRSSTTYKIPTKSAPKRRKSLDKQKSSKKSPKITKYFNSNAMNVKFDEQPIAEGNMKLRKRISDPPNENIEIEPQTKRPKISPAKNTDTKTTPEIIKSNISPISSKANPKDKNNKEKMKKENKRHGKKNILNKSKTSLYSDDVASDDCDINTNNSIVNLTSEDSRENFQQPSPDEMLQNNISPLKSALPKRNRIEDYAETSDNISKKLLNERSPEKVKKHKNGFTKTEIELWMTEGKKALEDDNNNTPSIEARLDKHITSRKDISVDYKLQTIERDPDKVKKFIKYWLKFEIQMRKGINLEATVVSEISRAKILSAFNQMTYKDFENLINVQRYISHWTSLGKSIEELEKNLKNQFTAFIGKEKSWPAFHIELAALQSYLHSKGIKGSILLKNIPPRVLSFDEVLEKTNIKEYISLSCDKPPESYTELMNLCKKEYEKCCCKGVWTEGLKFNDKGEEGGSSQEMSIELFTEPSIIEPPIIRNSENFQENVNQKENSNVTIMSKSSTKNSITKQRKSRKCGPKSRTKNSSRSDDDLEIKINQICGGEEQPTSKNTIPMVPIDTQELNRILTHSQTQPLFEKRNSAKNVDGNKQGSVTEFPKESAIKSKQNLEEKSVPPAIEILITPSPNILACTDEASTKCSDVQLTKNSTKTSPNVESEKRPLISTSPNIFANSNETYTNCSNIQMNNESTKTPSNVGSKRKHLQSSEKDVFMSIPNDKSSTDKQPKSPEKENLIPLSPNIFQSSGESYSKSVGSQLINVQTQESVYVPCETNNDFHTEQNDFSITINEVNDSEDPFVETFENQEETIVVRLDPSYMEQNSNNCSENTGITTRELNITEESENLVSKQVAMQNSIISQKLMVSNEPSISVEAQKISDSHQTHLCELNDSEKSTSDAAKLDFNEALEKTTPETKDSEETIVLKELLSSCQTVSVVSPEFTNIKNQTDDLCSTKPSLNLSYEASDIVDCMNITLEPETHPNNDTVNLSENAHNKENSVAMPKSIDPTPDFNETVENLNKKLLEENVQPEQNPDINSECFVNPAENQKDAIVDGKQNGAELPSDHDKILNKHSKQNVNNTETDLNISAESIRNVKVVVKREIFSQSFSQYDDDVQIIEIPESEPMVIDDEETAPELLEALLFSSSPQTKRAPMTIVHTTISNVTPSSIYLENFPQAQQFPLNFDLTQSQPNLNQSCNVSTNATSGKLNYQNVNTNNVGDASDCHHFKTPHNKAANMNCSTNIILKKSPGSPEATGNKSRKNISDRKRKLVSNKPVCSSKSRDDRQLSEDMSEMSYVSIAPQNIPSEIELSQTSSKSEKSAKYIELKTLFEELSGVAEKDARCPIAEQNSFGALEDSLDRSSDVELLEESIEDDIENSVSAKISRNNNLLEDCKEQHSEVDESFNNSLRDIAQKEVELCGENNYKEDKSSNNSDVSKTNKELSIGSKKDYVEVLYSSKLNNNELLKEKKTTDNAYTSVEDVLSLSDSGDVELIEDNEENDDVICKSIPERKEANTEMAAKLKESLKEEDIARNRETVEETLYPEIASQTKGAFYQEEDDCLNNSSRDIAQNQVELCVDNNIIEDKSSSKNSDFSKTYKEKSIESKKDYEALNSPKTTNTNLLKEKNSAENASTSGEDVLSLNDSGDVELIEDSEEDDDVICISIPECKETNTEMPAKLKESLKEEDIAKNGETVKESLYPEIASQTKGPFYQEENDCVNNSSRDTAQNQVELCVDNNIIEDKSSSKNSDVSKTYKEISIESKKDYVEALNSPKTTNTELLREKKCAENASTSGEDVLSLNDSGDVELIEDSEEDDDVICISIPECKETSTEMPAKLKESLKEEDIAKNGETVKESLYPEIASQAKGPFYQEENDCVNNSSRDTAQNQVELCVDNNIIEDKSSSKNSDVSKTYKEKSIESKKDYEALNSPKTTNTNLLKEKNSAENASTSGEDVLSLNDSGDVELLEESEEDDDVPEISKSISECENPNTEMVAKLKDQIAEESLHTKKISQTKGPIYHVLVSDSNTFEICNIDETDAKSCDETQDYSKHIKESVKPIKACKVRIPELNIQTYLKKPVVASKSQLSKGYEQELQDKENCRALIKSPTKLKLTEKDTEIEKCSSKVSLSNNMATSISHNLDPIENLIQQNLSKNKSINVQEQRFSNSSMSNSNNPSEFIQISTETCRNWDIEVRDVAVTSSTSVTNKNFSNTTTVADYSSINLISDVEDIAAKSNLNESKETNGEMLTRGSVSGIFKTNISILSKNIDATSLSTSIGENTKVSTDEYTPPASSDSFSEPSKASKNIKNTSVDKNLEAVIEELELKSSNEIFPSPSRDNNKAKNTSDNETFSESFGNMDIRTNANVITTSTQLELPVSNQKESAEENYIAPETSSNSSVQCIDFSFYYNSSDDDSSKLNHESKNEEKFSHTLNFKELSISKKNNAGASQALNDSKNENLSEGSKSILPVNISSTIQDRSFDIPKVSETSTLTLNPKKIFNINEAAKSCNKSFSVVLPSNPKLSCNLNKSFDSDILNSSKTSISEENVLKTKSLECENTTTNCVTGVGSVELTGKEDFEVTRKLSIDCDPINRVVNSRYKTSTDKPPENSLNQENLQLSKITQTEKFEENNIVSLKKNYILKEDNTQTTKHSKNMQEAIEQVLQIKRNVNKILRRRSTSEQRQAVSNSGKRLSFSQPTEVNHFDVSENLPHHSEFNKKYPHLRIPKTPPKTYSQRSFKDSSQEITKITTKKAETEISTKLETITLPGFILTDGLRNIQPNNEEYVEVPIMIEKRLLNILPSITKISETIQTNLTQESHAINVNVEFKVNKEQTVHSKDPISMSENEPKIPAVSLISCDEKETNKSENKMTAQENAEDNNPPTKLPVQLVNKAKTKLPQPSTSKKKTTPKKSSKLIDFVQQKTHAFSSIPLKPCNKPPKSKPPSLLTVEECDYLIEDASQPIATTTVSQILGTDCTYFENSELLRNLDEICIPHHPEIPELQIELPPQVEESTPNTSKVINLRPITLSEGVTARKVWQVNLQWKSPKAMSIEVRFSVNRRFMTVCDESAKLLFTFKPELWSDIQRVLREINHFEYKRRTLKYQLKSTSLHKVLRQLFHSSTQVVDVKLINDNYNPYTICEKTIPVYRKPFQCLTKGIAPKILSKMKFLKEKLQNNNQQVN